MTGLPLYPACTSEDPPHAVVATSYSLIRPVVRVRHHGGRGGRGDEDGRARCGLRSRWAKRGACRSPQSCERRRFNSDDDPDIVSSPARQRRSAAAGESCPLAVNEQVCRHATRDNVATPSPSSLNTSAICIELSRRLYVCRHSYDGITYAFTNRHVVRRAAATGRKGSSRPQPRRRVPVPRSRNPRACSHQGASQSLVASSPQNAHTVRRRPGYKGQLGWFTCVQPASATTT